MNKMITCVFAIVLLAGCAHTSPVVYAHKDGTDWITVESNGDNMSDFNSLKKQAETMCVERGEKNGINIVDAGPGPSPTGRPYSSYTLAFKCKSDSHVAETFDKAKEAAGRAITSVGEAVTSYVKDAREKVKEASKDKEN